MADGTIWKKEFKLEALDSVGASCMPGFLDIKFTDYGEDYITATMPVTSKNKQPMGLLHGGASVVLAETIGSVAAILCIDDPSKTSVGVEINANHLRAVRGGTVTATARPAKIGRNLQVWNIELRDDEGRLTCVSRFTVAIVDIK